MDSAIANVQITTATDGDRRWTAQIMATSAPWTTLGVSYDQCLLTCLDQRYMVLIARTTEAVGAVIVDPKGLAGSPYIKSIAVAESARKTGVGAQLIAAAESAMLPHSPHMFLCVSSFNTRAQSFYRKLGYKQVGEFKDYIASGESEFLFYKRQ